MPSLEHEATLRLFRNRPALAPELLREALHLELPAYSEARIESAELTEIAPAEYRADLVVLLVDGRPVLAIVVEVQLQRDERKRYTWPVYVAELRARFECPSCVLVITASDSVAEWCRTPIEVGPGFTHVPLVVGPELVPIVDDVARAEADPELAVLSVLAHGRELGGEAVGRAALVAVRNLDDDRRVLYSDLILYSLSAAATRALEDLMTLDGYVFKSDYFKNRLAEGREEAMREGREEGREKGREEGRAQAVVAVLTARGVTLSDLQRTQVLECRDHAQLDTWLARAAVATRAEDLF